MKTFSESWHRVRDAIVCLRPQIRVHRQYFRGEKWFVLHEPFNQQFFRLPPASYDFVARLDGSRSVHQAWEESLEENPDDAPGQQDVIELLAQLFASQLIVADLPVDTVALFERFKKRRRQEITSKVLSAMFARFPLWDPDDFLRRLMPLANLVLNRWGLIVWAMVVLFGIKVVIDHRGAVSAQASLVLEPANLIWLFVVTAIVKLFHEFGHAILCRKFGGAVHTFGVMLMIFTPMPFVDATAAWAFRDRAARMLVGAGGMIVELFIAGIAAQVWAHTQPGLLNTLAFNVMFSASVATLLFNLNPLLRFDGYYILMDWLGLPNLYQRSLRYLRYLGERYLFGLRREKPTTQNISEKRWLICYGILGGIYRLMLFASITLFVAGQFLLVGIVLAVFCVVAWVLVPAGRFVLYLASDPKLQRVRPRAIGASMAIAAGLVVVLAFIPLPSHIRTMGFVEADEYTLVAASNPGIVQAVLVPSGQQVSAGQPLLQLSDPPLELDLNLVQAQLQEATARQRQTLAANAPNQRTVDSVLDTLRKREQELVRRKTELTVVARHPGLWVAPRLNDAVGRWFPRGTILGEVINPSKFLLVSKVQTRDALPLVSGKLRGIQIRLLGQASRPIQGTSLKFSQAAPEVSESEAAAKRSRAARSNTQEPPPTPPTFEIRVELGPGTERVTLLHGQSGIIRFDLPWEPITTQCLRKLRQMFQNHPV